METIVLGIALVVVALVMGAFVVSLRKENKGLQQEVQALKNVDVDAIRKELRDAQKENQKLIKEHQDALLQKDIQHDTKTKQHQVTVDKAFSNQTIQHDQKLSELRITIRSELAEEFTKKYKSFEENKISEIQKRADENATTVARIELDRWIEENKSELSAKAIKSSRHINFGMITQHLMPFFKDFKFNHKDVRFIGSPIDLIVFDGLTEEKDSITIHIIEVKTGTSKLNKVQQKIKLAVHNKHVEWHEMTSSGIVSGDGSLFT